MEKSVNDLKFEKFKTDWEHHRATILNYTLSLVTIWVFGIRYLVIDLLENHIMLAGVFLFSIAIVTGFAIKFMWSGLKKIDKIKRDMEKIINRTN